MTAERSADPSTGDRQTGLTARVVAAAVVLALTAAACAGDGDRAGGGDGAGGAAITVDQVASSPPEEGISALNDPHHPDLPTSLVDLAEIVSGGPPPDGIPPIDEPRFEAADAVDWLDDDEPVLAFTHQGDTRAYPVQILTWHEIVNDTVAGIPVTVTYCPLCNSAVAFDRRLDDRILDFGTSGKLYRSALVMYDRQTESLWTHYTGQAVVGRLAGKVLEALPVSTVSWEDFRNAHPDGLVLSRQTGFDRDYGRNPYPGYDDVDTSPFLFEGEVDGRLAAKTRIVGVESGGDAVAITLDLLSERRVVPVTAGGQDLVVWWKPGTASALDSSRVADGRDVGASGVLVPTVDGRTLHFEPAGDEFVDTETGTRWDVLGRAVSGPLEGRSLQAVPHVDTFWFAWAAYLPHTTVLAR
ncbi:MAG: DUF3179 domain-containing protein [Actinomycetota bacterium]|nr:DUF3179 domain-containing protein [Actinomycetota bacterium]